MQVFDRELPEFNGQPVDARLVLLAKHLKAKIITHDYNLNKVAQVHGVEVINLNDLSHALKPIFLPGEQLEVHLIKAGEAAGQGIGYLEDGTMIVVEAGRDRLNQTVKITVTSVLQTSRADDLRTVIRQVEHGGTSPPWHPPDDLRALDAGAIATLVWQGFSWCRNNCPTKRGAWHRASGKDVGR